jgi:hypothetical protein
VTSFPCFLQPEPVVACGPGSFKISAQATGTFVTRKRLVSRYGQRIAFHATLRFVFDMCKAIATESARESPEFLGEAGKASAIPCARENKKRK